jgi:hypothetical protein
MYDEKNTYFCGAKYNNDGYRIVFTRWVYDFDWGGSPEYCWKIVYLYYTYSLYLYYVYIMLILVFII